MPIGDQAAALNNGSSAGDHDTDERRRQDRQLEGMRRLAGVMAHDFNNRLGTITANLGLARDQVADDDLREMIDEALAAAWAAADLNRRLLAFACRQHLNPMMIDINRIIADTMRLSHRLLGDGVSIELDLGDVGPVVADPGQFEAALLDVAVNAREAMPDGGRLIFSTRNKRLGDDAAAPHLDADDGGFVLLEVSDTGGGMSPDIMHRIFEPFFTTKEKGRGTGLGLSAVSGFILQTGGHVDVRSEPGVGTTVRLCLPRGEANAEQPNNGSSRAAARRDQRVALVIDEDQGARFVLQCQLRVLGYRAIESERAAAALEILHKNPVDLLVANAALPGGLDGFELARLVRDRWPGIKIVLMCEGEQAAAPGCAAESDLQLLTRPCDSDEFAVMLQAALR